MNIHGQNSNFKGKIRTKKTRRIFSWKKRESDGRKSQGKAAIVDIGMYSCIGTTAFALVLSIRAASGGGSGRFFDEEVIASIDGVVGAGNYSRYTFSEKENSRLVLTTM